MGSMLPYIAAPWIRHGVYIYVCVYIYPLCMYLSIFIYTCIVCSYVSCCINIYPLQQDGTGAAQRLPRRVLSRVVCREQKRQCRRGQRRKQHNWQGWRKSWDSGVMLCSYFLHVIYYIYIYIYTYMYIYIYMCTEWSYNVIYPPVSCGLLEHLENPHVV